MSHHRTDLIALGQGSGLGLTGGCSCGFDTNQLGMMLAAGIAFFALYTAITMQGSGRRKRKRSMDAAEEGPKSYHMRKRDDGSVEGALETMADVLREEIYPLLDVGFAGKHGEDFDLTEHFTISKPSNPSIDKCYELKKR